MKKHQNQRPSMMCIQKLTSYDYKSALRYESLYIKNLNHWHMTRQIFKLYRKMC